jgi:hypothetical protein
MGSAFLLGEERGTTRRTDRSTMNRMRRPENRVVLMSLAFVGIGSFAGALLDRLSFPRISRVLNVCASSKQFIVEFRTNERTSYGDGIPGLFGRPLNWGVTLEVDGTRVGELPRYGFLRRFFCEGNHRARIRYPIYSDQNVQEHAVDFAVSRPSLFHLTEIDLPPNLRSATCVSGSRCGSNVDLELSPYGPDDPRARLFPLETQR